MVIATILVQLCKSQYMSKKCQNMQQKHTTHKKSVKRQDNDGVWSIIQMEVVSHALHLHHAKEIQAAEAMGQVRGLA